MPRPPRAHNWGTFQVETFSRIPGTVAEEIFQCTGSRDRNMDPSSLARVPEMAAAGPSQLEVRTQAVGPDEIMAICHVSDWMKTLEYWGNDLFDGPSRRKTWLGRYMLDHG